MGQDSAAHYERYEGMLVELAAVDGVVHGPTKRYTSGESEIAILPTHLQPALRSGRILRTSEEDGRGDDDWAGESLLYLSTLIGGDLPTANWSDRVFHAESTPVLAVLDYNFGKYQFLLLPDQGLAIEANERPDGVSQHVSSDEFAVCTFNVHGLGRGEAQTPIERDYSVQLHRIAEHIAEYLSYCTIISVQETGTVRDAENLARLLSNDYALPFQALAVTGPMSADAEFPLTNSYLVRSDRVTVADYFAQQGCSPVDYGVQEPNNDGCPTGAYPLFNRPPLILDALVAGEWGAPYPVRLINNHWKSKAGDESVNAKRRLQQAQHVANLADEWHAQNEVANLVVLGDLNDFVMSDPLRPLTLDSGAPLVNAWRYLPAHDQYSYIFNGASQVLDHILISQPMVQSISGVDALHVNADMATCLSDALTAECQVSDHDPQLIRIRPDGAVIAAVDVGYADVSVQIVGQATGVRTEGFTDVGGSYRFWGLDAGDYQVVYHLPTWLRLEGGAGALTDTVTLTLGYNELVAPPLVLESATAAAKAVTTLADAVE